MARQHNSPKLEEKTLNMSGLKLLANGIITQAIEDWKSLCRGAMPTSNVSFYDLRYFFRSDYCTLLLHGTNLSGEYILEELEDMREATKYGTSIQTWTKRRTEERKRGKLNNYKK